MTTIIGYTYEAGAHCVDCATSYFSDKAGINAAWGSEHDTHGNPLELENGEPISPIFSTDETPEGGTYCDDCRECIQERPPYQGKPLSVPVRFFIYDDEAGDIFECDEAAFLDCNYAIDYKRHTVFANGVSQICLTKMPQS